jgi:hypothetical protein
LCNFNIKVFIFYVAHLHIMKSDLLEMQPFRPLWSNYATLGSLKPISIWLNYLTLEGKWIINNNCSSNYVN